MSAPPPRLTVEAESLVPYVAPEDYPEDLRLALAAYEERMGFLPNAIKLYAHRPEILELLIRLNDTVMRSASGHLDSGLKRRLGAKLAIVLWSGANRHTSHITSTLRPASRSRRRLD